MEQELKGLSDYIAILNRRKKQLTTSVLVILLVSIALAVGLPSVYRSEATILIEQQQIPMDMVRSTVTSYAGERIQIISQMVMTTDNLGKIIEKYDLYEEARAESSMSMVVEAMREDVTLEMISADVVDPRSGRPTTTAIAFKIAFSHKNPRLAQKVTNELVSLYLNENLRRRTQAALETSGFLSDEVVKLKLQVAGLEEALAKFKEKNTRNWPELQQLNIQLMERAEWELKTAEQQIRTLSERKIYLQSELDQVSAMSMLYSVDGERVLSTEDRLNSLQAQYVTLSARYLPEHPDLISMGKEIEALQKETGAGSDVKALRLQLKELKVERVSLSERYSPLHPDITKLQRAIERTQAALDQAVKEKKTDTAMAEISKPDNPAYIQLKAQLNAVDADLKSWRRTKNEFRAKIDEFEQRLLTSPQVEREYRAITRDYENALARYRDVMAKQQEAELAESLERERKGERFSLIEPPQLPEEPSEPNRLAILFIGLIFSVAGGIATVALAESLNNAIKTPEGLVSVMGGPPLVVIPYIENDADRARKKLVRLSIGIGIAVAFIGGIVGFHLVVMPLDIAWFVILRRLGLAA